MNTAEAQVIVAVIATGGVVVGALIPVWWQMKRLRLEHRDTNEQVGQVNDAVNHRHERHGVDAPHMYDAVLELLSWKKRWDGIDPGWDSASRLNGQLEGIHREVADLRSDFQAHVDDVRQCLKEQRDLEP